MCRRKTKRPARKTKSLSRPIRAWAKLKLSGWSKTPRQTPPRTISSANGSKRAIRARPCCTVRKKSLAEYGGKLEAGEKTAVEEAIKALEATLNDHAADKAEIDAKAQALSQAAQKIGEKMMADLQAK